MANNSWEDTFSGNFKQRPMLGALTMGIAPALATGFGKIANTMTYQPTPEDKAANQAHFQNEINDRLGSGIGSSQGATRLGVPTPSGTAPIVSFNLGGNTNKSLPATPIKPTQTQKSQAPAKVVAAPTKGVAKGIKSKVSGNGGGSGEAVPNYPDEEGLRAKPTPLPSAGYGAYADGTPIVQMYSDQDLDLMPGSNHGTYNQNGTQLGLNYSPQEMVANQAQALALQTSVPTAPAARDMSPGSQGEWEANQGALNRLAAFAPSGNMPVTEFLRQKTGLKNMTGIADANYRDVASQNMKDTFGLAQQELPSKIRGTNATANYHDIMGAVAASEAPYKNAHSAAETRGILDGTIPLQQAQRGQAIADAGRTNQQTKALEAVLPYLPSEKLAGILKDIQAGNGRGAGANGYGVDLPKYAETIAKLEAQKQMTDDPVAQGRLEEMIVNLRREAMGTPAKGTVAPLPKITLQ